MSENPYGWEKEYPKPYILRYHKDTWMSMEFGDLTFLISKTPDNIDIEIGIVNLKEWKVLQEAPGIVELIRPTGDYEGVDDNEVLLSYAECENI